MEHACTHIQYGDKLVIINIENERRKHPEVSLWPPHTHPHVNANKHTRTYNEF